MVVAFRGMFFVKVVCIQMKCESAFRRLRVEFFYYGQSVKMGDLEGQTFLHLEGCFLLLYYWKRLALNSCFVLYSLRNNPPSTLS
jgi:hypothetical protein